MYINKLFEYNVFIPNTQCMSCDNNWWIDIIDHMQTKRFYIKLDQHHQLCAINNCTFIENTMAYEFKLLLQNG